MCCAAFLGSRTLSTRLKASMAEEAAADNAQRNAERKITARIMMLKEYQYLKSKYFREDGGALKRGVLEDI